MSRSGQEALPDVQEKLGCPPGFSEVVGRPSRMFGSDWKSLPDVWEWSGIYLGCPKAVKRLSWMFGIGRETNSGVVVLPCRCPEVVGRPSRMSRSGRDAFPDVRESS